MTTLRYALRSLLRARGFAVLTVLTLGLGLTINAVLFTVANEIYVRPLPVNEPERLVLIAQRTSVIDYQIPFSYADVDDLRRDTQSGDLSRTFSDLMGYRDQVVHLSAGDHGSARVWVHAVTDNYFAVLGVQPQLGRFLAPGEGAKPGTAPVLVLSDRCWRGQFAADPAVVGRTVKLNGIPFTVIGVAPSRFTGAAWGADVSAFVPSGMLPLLVPGGEYYMLKRGNTSHFAMARLKPGVEIAQARTAVALAYARIKAANPGYYAPDARAVLMAELLSRPSPYIAHRAPQIIAALSALSLLVLVVAIANTANLLYARAQSRERELAIRSALGASRFSLLRLLVAESTVLALAAGGLGFVASTWLTPALVRLFPSSAATPPAYDQGPDWRPPLMTMAAAFAVGILAGLLPALKASSVAPLPLLKAGTPIGGDRRHAVRTALVVAQVAVSCVVLVCSGLALRSVVLLGRVDLGYRPADVVTASFDLDLQRYSADDGRAFQRRLLERVRRLPGVQAASLVVGLPTGTDTPLLGGIRPVGGTRPDAEYPAAVASILVEPTYLETLGLRVEAGRGLTASDRFGTPLVVLVNRALADQLWPGDNPVGRQINLQDRDRAEVVGVLGRSRYYSLTDDARPIIMGVLEQNYRGNAALVVRTAGSQAAVIGAIRGVFRELDPDLPVYGVQPLWDAIVASPNGLLMYRGGAVLAAVHAVIALALATSGIFGLISFLVTMKTREIGIRVALGATRRQVVAVVARAGSWPTVAGLAVGIALSGGVIRLLQPLLYQETQSDTPLLIAVALVITIAAVLACWFPARRALRIDPVDALRAE